MCVTVFRICRRIVHVSVRLCARVTPQAETVDMNKDTMNTQEDPKETAGLTLSFLLTVQPTYSDRHTLTSHFDVRTDHSRGADSTQTT